MKIIIRLVYFQYDCKKPCARLMKNCQTKTDDHLCKKMCYEECEVCNIQIKKERSCGHFHTISCGDDVEKLNCNKRCKRVLPCGHICKQKCSEQCGNCREKVKKDVLRSILNFKHLIVAFDFRL